MLSTYEILQRHRAGAGAVAGVVVGTGASAQRHTMISTSPTPLRLVNTARHANDTTCPAEWPPISVWHEFAFGVSVFMGCMLMLSVCMLPTYAAITFAIENLETPTARASLAPASLVLQQKSCAARRDSCFARGGLSRSPIDDLRNFLPL